MSILVIVAVLAAALLFGAVAALLCARRPAHPGPEPAAEADPALDTTRFVVGRNEVMAGLLLRAGLSQPLINRVVPALRAAGFGFTAMRPGESLFVLADSSAVRHLVYQQSYERAYRVDIDSSVLVSMLLRDVRTELALVRGAITSSLYQALIDLGESAQLVYAFTDIFGWEVDFFSEPQPGDSFLILVERRFAGTRPLDCGPILAARYSGPVGDFAGYRFTDPEGRTDCYNDSAQCLRKTFLKSPLRFSRVSSHFGRRRHPIRRVVRQHFGVDYVAPKGTPVECVSDGRVVSAGWSGGYGRMIEVGHEQAYTTRYGHLSGFARGVRSGAPVKQGDVIGFVGSTGLSTGPHLHFEVRKHGSAINPLRFDPPREAPVKLAFAGQFRAARDSLSRLIGRLSAQPPPPPSPSR